MDRFAITFNDYTKFAIKSSNQSCDYCIRPASKQVILVNMKTVQVCRFNNGFYCCDEACNEWSFPDGTCILHGRIPKYTQGYARIIREVISEVMSDDSDADFIKREITNAKNFSIKEVIEVLYHFPYAYHTSKYCSSLAKKLKLIYGTAISRAALKHWLIKQVFHNYGISALYPNEIVWN